MVHASSINCSDTVRQAVIARFHSTKYGLALLSDDGGVASDGNLWKYWGPEVREGPEPDPAAVEGFAASWQLLDSPPPAVRHPLDRGEGDLERCAQHPLLSLSQLRRLKTFLRRISVHGAGLGTRVGGAISRSSTTWRHGRAPSGLSSECGVAACASQPNEL